MTLQLTGHDGLIGGYDGMPDYYRVRWCSRVFQMVYYSSAVPVEHIVQKKSHTIHILHHIHVCAHVVLQGLMVATDGTSRLPGNGSKCLLPTSIDYYM